MILPHKPMDYSSKLSFMSFLLSKKTLRLNEAFYFKNTRFFEVIVSPKNQITPK